MASPEVSSPRVIYDIGSNNGDDLPYYLLKADIVVAVEANPSLCEQIRSRFTVEIESGRLLLVHAALVCSDETSVDFYLHKHHHVLGTLRPAADKIDQYTKLRVNATSISDLVSSYGNPYYAKIDVEGYDRQILTAFLGAAIKPAYISAEAHSLSIFSLLSEDLGYKSFKLVDGRSVSSSYKRALFYSPIRQQMVAYSFPRHSAGPFGNDIFGEWMDKASFLRLLAFRGLGWRDIHASSVDTPTLKG